MKRLNIAYGILGGVLLYFPYLFSGYIPLLEDSASKINSNTAILLIDLSIILSVLLVAFFTVYKYTSPLYAILRTIIMYACPLFLFSITAELGVMRWLDGLLNLSTRNSETAGPGLIMATVLLSCMLVSILINIIVPAWMFIKTKISPEL